jgi:hypothetical protein
LDLDAAFNKARLKARERKNQRSAPGVSLGQTALVWKDGFADNAIMAQTKHRLEARLERVERELAQLKAALAGKKLKPWYEEIVGSFKNDEAFAEIIRLGRLIRQGKLKR